MDSVIFPRKAFSIVPTIVPAAYASGDQIGTEGKYQLANIVEGPNALAVLESVSIVDQAKAKSAIDLLFWNANPTITSTDNNPFDLTDAEAVAKYIGTVSIPAANYGDLNSNSVGCVVNCGLDLQSHMETANSDGKSLWVSIVSRGTPTYTSASDLKIRLNFQSI